MAAKKKPKNLSKKRVRTKQIKKALKPIKRFKKPRKPKITPLAKKVALALLIIFAISMVWLFWGTPLPGQLSSQQAVSTKIFDRNGALIYEIFADERRTPVELEELPDHLINATIAIEDKDFYSHHGFSITGIARALYSTVFKQELEGGSTLTQQLVKNTLLSPERTIRRKIREFALAIGVEVIYSKDEILELYLNEIPYGSTAYGIEAASELYFGKSAKDLTLAEASMLAGLPQAPSRYSPFGSRPEFAKGRQETVLRRMAQDGYITQEEADLALNEELVYAEPKNLKAPHFALWIKEQLAEKYGDAVVEKGGLRVTTTLDLELQEFAEAAVKEEVENLSSRNVGNGAALVTRPGTGEILAMVGSKDYFAEDEDGKVNIIFANRQPGSSIKPLNYALAIANKRVTASTPLADVPTCFSVIGQESYCPKNYDGNFHGSTQLRFALGNSYNIPAVRLLALNGIEDFIDFANKLGITTFKDPSRYGLSLTLGGGEVIPYDMATAFGVLANQGVKKPLISFISISDWTGKELFKRDITDVEGDRVMDPEPAFIISHILHDNNARIQAFGGGSQLLVRGHPEVSVKTGTTNDLRDNWTIGYTEQALVLAWVGNNDNSPMSGAVSGVSGASPIWNTIMGEVLDKAEEGFYDEREKGHAWPKQPDSIVGASVCANTGALPSPVTQDCPTRFEFFIEGTVPEIEGGRRDIFVFNDTGSPANAEATPEQVHMENHLVIFDPLGTQICLDCAGPMTDVSIRYPIPE